MCRPLLLGTFSLVVHREEGVIKTLMRMTISSLWKRLQDRMKNKRKNE